MTILVQFAPAPRQPFIFAPVLDGTAQQAVVTWNLSGRRWYVSIYTPTGTRVCTVPVVGSADPLAVASASWDNLRQRVAIVTAAPHGFVVGSVVLLDVAGFAPVAYNGTAQPCVVLDPQTVAAPMPADPGAAVVLGTVASEVNLVANYFSVSTLIYRTSSNNFEISP